MADLVVVDRPALRLVSTVNAQRPPSRTAPHRPAARTSAHHGFRDARRRTADWPDATFDAGEADGGAGTRAVGDRRREPQTCWARRDEGEGPGRVAFQGQDRFGQVRGQAASGAAQDGIQDFGRGAEREGSPCSTAHNEDLEGGAPACFDIGRFCSGADDTRNSRPNVIYVSTRR